ncbi:MAG: N-acetyltransferase [Propionibacteriales bacterium]|nr:N-acetyltransferase [Propionibacteriales bacterium]
MVCVRSATRADAAAIQAIYTPVVVDSAISFEEAPPDEEEIVRRMLSEPRLPWLVATQGQAVVGYAYASIHRARRAYRWSADCSIYLREQEWGRGTGRRLYQQLFAELRGLGYVSVFAGIALPNDASVGIHEAMGFVPVGAFQQVGFKHGSWHDVGWWQLGLTPPSSTPREPRPWEP